MWLEITSNQIEIASAQTIFTARQTGSGRVSAAKVVGTVSTRSTAATRRRSIVALVAALALFAAALGYWALRAEISTDAPQPVAAALVNPNSSPAQLADHSVPPGHVHSVSNFSYDKTLKSAGLKRDRPTTFTSWASQAFSSPSLDSRAAGVGPIGITSARAPAGLHACSNLLTQLCVSRR
jgi:hypothetical protein